MRQTDLLEYVQRQPFQPFRLHLSTGAFFDIRQPQMVDVGRSTLTLGFDLEGNQQRFVLIALIHIAWLEVLLPVS
jgi:hypothetical protein